MPTKSSTASARPRPPSRKIDTNIAHGINVVRRRQDAKHGAHAHSVGEWLLILEAELSKAKRAWQEGDEAMAHARILEVTAVGVASLEQHGVADRVLIEKGRKQF